MSPLLALPTEAMLLITAHVDLADKAAVALTCKSLHNVVTPAMYNHIDLEWSFSNSPPIKLLLHTMVENPKRADQVLTVRFAGEKCRFATLRGPERVYVQRVARKAGLSNIAPYDEVFKLDDESSIAELYPALFVFQLSSLHTLKIGHHETTGFEALSKAVQYVLCLNQSNHGLKRFQNLQYIDLCYDMDRRDLARYVFDAHFQHGSSSILPFFYMPQAKGLRVVIPEAGPELMWPCDPPCALTLTSLTLHRSGIEPHNLTELLRATPSLCHLTYDHCIQLERPLNGIVYLDNDRLCTALENVATTLESLVICVQFYQMCETNYEMDNFQSTVGGFTSFVGLVKLQRLEVPLIVLLGAHPEPITFPIQRLPLNLRHLSLTDDLAMHSYFPWRSSSVLELFPHNTSSNGRLAKGNLAVLEMILRESDEDWSTKSKSQLCNMCNRAGIVCKFTHLMQVRFPWE